LKYFTEEAPEYHIAAAGSLLGGSINRKRHSFPVGKIQFLTMHPLDFEDFLLAQEKDKAVSIIRDSYESNEACGLHETFVNDYRAFIGVGGMPQVVNEFGRTRDYNMVMAMQKNIIDAYIADMAKYAGPSETVKIIG
jgi:predicted AAA+ superfamily ATPase